MTSATPLERMMMSKLGITAKRPLSPRDVQVDPATGLIKWTPPANPQDLTHYRVRLNTDVGDPAFEVSGGQTSVQVPAGTKVFVSSYNNFNDQESAPVAINSQAASVPTGGSPTGLAASPKLGEYGVFSIEKVTVNGITGDETEAGIVIEILVVDELTQDVWATAGAIDASEDPVTLTPAINPDRTTDPSICDFEANDWILFNDNGNYEIAGITAKNEDGTWEVTRHPAEAGTGEAAFGSLMAVHSAGVQIFKAQIRRYVLPAPIGGYTGTDSGEQYNFDLPACVVLGFAATPFNSIGFGDRAVVNCATATLPGLRTLTGAVFTLPVGGSLAVQALASVPLDVQYLMPLRMICARVGTAPAGGDIGIDVRVSTDAGVSWTTLTSLVISDGSQVSWSGELELPWDRRIPYGMDWPALLLTPGALLSADITSVGATTAGSDLRVELYT